MDPIQLGLLSIMGVGALMLLGVVVWALIERRVLRFRQKLRVTGNFWRAMGQANHAADKAKANMRAAAREHGPAGKQFLAPKPSSSKSVKEFGL